MSQPSTEPAAVIRTSDNQLFCCKSIDKLISESETPGQRLQKTLGPWSLTALGIGRFLKFYNRFKFHMHAIEVASGGLLIALGVLLVLGRFTMISGWLSFLNRFAL